ncbi:MAG: hypothetical protein OQK78_12770, partial [Gammaproteobacteria bacterium]|nr:hypothetical protein [Gammaproteobacteria bacterium]
RSGLLLCQEAGGGRTIGVTKDFAGLPYTDEFIRADVGGGTYYHCSGTLEVSVITNTGVSGRLKQNFEWSWDGTVARQTQNDEVDTLPVGVTATTTAISGDRFGITLDFDDTAGSGTDCRVSCRLDFSWSIL